MLGVRLLGGFRLWREQVLLPVKTQALRELLSYLILNNKPIRRETVAEDLWGEQTTGDACKKLRQQLWLLRSLLSEHHLSEFQLSEDENHDTLHLEIGKDVEIDVFQIRQAWQLLAPGVSISLVEMDILNRAVSLYESDLLEGCNAQWCLQERERYRDLMGSIFERLIASCKERARWQQAFEYTQKALLLEPTRESVHYQAIWLHVQQADYVGALRQFERCTRVLQDAFGVKPSPATTALISVGTPYSGADRRTNPSLLETVMQMQNTLSDLVQRFEKT